MEDAEEEDRKVQTDEEAAVPGGQIPGQVDELAVVTMETEPG